jgi:hypothetical protein
MNQTATADDRTHIPPSNTMPTRRAFNQQTQAAAIFGRADYALSDRLTIVSANRRSSEQLIFRDESCPLGSGRPGDKLGQYVASVDVRWAACGWRRSIKAAAVRVQLIATLLKGRLQLHLVKYKIYAVSITFASAFCR